MYDELTKKDIAKMEEEIEYRKLTVRKQALEAVKEARAHGDLSENFEYHAAKKDKNQNESRIRYLERMIKTAKVISDESKEDEVGVNNTVEVYFEEDDFDGFAKRLKTLAVAYIHPVKEHPWGQRVVRFRDPDGHIIEVGERMTAVCRRFLDSGLTPEQTAARMDVPVDYVRERMG